MRAGQISSQRNYHRAFRGVEISRRQPGRLTLVFCANEKDILDVIALIRCREVQSQVHQQLDPWRIRISSTLFRGKGLVIQVRLTECPGGSQLLKPTWK